MFKLTISDLEY